MVSLSTSPSGAALLLPPVLAGSSSPTGSPAAPPPLLDLSTPSSRADGPALLTTDDALGLPWSANATSTPSTPEALLAWSLLSLPAPLPLVLPVLLPAGVTPAALFAAPEVLCALRTVVASAADVPLPDVEVVGITTVSASTGASGGLLPLPTDAGLSGSCSFARAAGIGAVAARLLPALTPTTATCGALLAPDAGVSTFAVPPACTLPRDGAAVLGPSLTQVLLLLPRTARVCLTPRTAGTASALTMVAVNDLPSLQVALSTLFTQEGVAALAASTGVDEAAAAALVTGLLRLSGMPLTSLAALAPAPLCAVSAAELSRVRTASFPAATAPSGLGEDSGPSATVAAGAAGAAAFVAILAAAAAFFVRRRKQRRGGVKRRVNGVDGASRGKAEAAAAVAGSQRNALQASAGQRAAPGVARAGTGVPRLALSSAKGAMAGGSGRGVGGAQSLRATATGNEAKASVAATSLAEASGATSCNPMLGAGSGAAAASARARSGGGSAPSVLSAVASPLAGAGAAAGAPAPRKRPQPPPDASLPAAASLPRARFRNEFLPALARDSAGGGSSSSSGLGEAGASSRRKMVGARGLDTEAGKATKATDSSAVVASPLKAASARRDAEQLPPRSPRSASGSRIEVDHGSKNGGGGAVTSAPLPRSRSRQEFSPALPRDLPAPGSKGSSRRKQ